MRYVFDCDRLIPGTRLHRNRVRSGTPFDRRKAIANSNLNASQKKYYYQAMNPLPTLNEYRTTIQQFLDLYRGDYANPNVVDKTVATDPCTWDYTPWNEPNSALQPSYQWDTKPTQPTTGGWEHYEVADSGPGVAVREGVSGPRHFGAAMAAAYWRTLKTLLENYCTVKSTTFTGHVVAGDFESRFKWKWGTDADRLAWNHSFWRWTPTNVTNWAWHYYSDIGKAGDSTPEVGFRDFRSFYAGFKNRGKLSFWLAEGGPIYKNSKGTSERVGSAKRFYRDLPLQGPMWGRVAAVYLYSWIGANEWDSGVFARGVGPLPAVAPTEGKFENGQFRPELFGAFKGIVMTGDTH